MILPNGTVTFLFTDIEGSTRLWEQHPDAMRDALAQHDTLMREAIEASEGAIFKTVGDAFCAAFATASDATTAALTAQQTLDSVTWPDAVTIRVRMALYTGVAEVRDNDYFGQSLNRLARLLAVGHGGQILLATATQELVRDTLPTGATLRELGQHRLKDLTRPEGVYQLCHPSLPDVFPPLRSLSHPDLRNNLPQQPTSFIGRAREVAEVKALLAKTRLLTLVGSGGNGKTRLSLQVAADLLDSGDDTEDGVWLVELAALSDPERVVQTVANTLDIKETPGEPLLKTLTEALKPKRLLILLDNCEHVLDATARLADTLLRNCPYVRLLASSREALNIAGETTYRLPPLSLPDPKTTQTVATVSQYEAVRLFIERAQAVQPNFIVTNANAPALAQLCFQLDGIPLAIELAAARIRSLSVAEIAVRLDQRFRLLTGGSRTLLPRQQTLRSLIDWSYDLLTEPEKSVLRRVSTFRGGWTVEAAEAVCSDTGQEPIEEWEVLDHLLNLVDKSLVVAEEQGEVTRYRLLETIRQYAHDRLHEGAANAMEAVQEKHAAYFVHFAEEAHQHLFGADQAAWLNRLELEHDNFRAALRFCIATGPDHETRTQIALRLCWAAGWLWHYRGYWTEGCEWCAAALSLPQNGEQDALRGQVHCQAGRFALYQGDFTAARVSLESSRELAQQAQDIQTLSITLNTLGNVEFDQGEYVRARELYKECLVFQPARGEESIEANLLANLGGVAAALGDPDAAREFQEQALKLHRQKKDGASIALALENLGSLASDEGDMERARTLLEESVQLNREMGNKPDIAYSLRALGYVAIEQGNLEEARTLLQESLNLAREVGARGLIPLVLETLVGVFVAEGNAEQAAQILGATGTLRTRWNIPREPTVLAVYEKFQEQVHAALDEATYISAYDTGATLTLDETILIAGQERN